MVLVLRQLEWLWVVEVLSLEVGFRCLMEAALVLRQPELQLVAKIRLLEVDFRCLLALQLLKPLVMVSGG